VRDIVIVGDLDLDELVDLRNVAPGRLRALTELLDDGSRPPWKPRGRHHRPAASASLLLTRIRSI
jgi:hypothetical protein